MNLKILLADKEKLKKDLTHFVLKTRVFDRPIKKNKKSFLQVFLMNLEEKLYSMTENNLIEYFDSLGNMCAEITPVFYVHNNYDIIFRYSIYDKKGDLITEGYREYSTRKEATIHCVEKMIELSND